MLPTLLVTAVLTASLLTGDPNEEAARRAILEAALPDAAERGIDPDGPGDQETFLAVLGSDLFLHGELGPLDVYVMRAGGFERETTAKRALDDAVEGLEPIVPVIERHFDGDEGLVAGRRFPIVLAHGDKPFDQLIALLKWCEDDYSGWKQDGNELWTLDLRRGVVVRTWEVQLFNLAHQDVKNQGSFFSEHGLGYYTLAHIATRVLRQGAWGMVPPWLAQGVIDELDIEAYGKAWVGGDWWVRQTPGWSRPGWSGFVPQGSSPPPPVTGPPADLGSTTTKGGDSWQHRDNSTSRHWADLVADRKSEAPASFLFMAEHESFLPRDRALARAFMHLLLDVAPPDGRPGFLQQLDRIPHKPPNGMPDVDPLPVVLNEVLGGVAGVNILESMPTGDMLEQIGRPEIAAEIRALGGEPILELTDHREQAAWLYTQTTDVMNADVRQKLWELILSAEYYQQLWAWRYLGDALDKRMAAALSASKAYPSRDKTRQQVASAFWSPPES